MRGQAAGRAGEKQHKADGPKWEDLYKTAVALTAAYGGAHAEAEATAPAEGLFGDDASAHEGPRSRRRAPPAHLGDFVV